jgi:hypothetical protein
VGADIWISVSSFPARIYLLDLWTFQQFPVHRRSLKSAHLEQENDIQFYDIDLLHPFMTISCISHDEIIYISPIKCFRLWNIHEDGFCMSRYFHSAMRNSQSALLVSALLMYLAISTISEGKNDFLPKITVGVIMQV